ncbi:MAG: DUF349 domain-containing protein [Reichenbachiella sp.]|uniref:DUF349 domain-containing protein n=1 Tax=Reichenbachiella sp. TaxID=2184521 RepID=UPI002966CCE6|nr:DUF349 domain-containing protein [Reichenbachiella sp.]MDW3210880.1 DUF349 domain-containing protein [Reichenbachiella sp.]
MTNENEMTGSTDEKSTNPGAVQENPELTNENETKIDSTSDSSETEVPQAEVIAEASTTEETTSQEETPVAEQTTEEAETAPEEKEEVAESPQAESKEEPTVPTEEKKAADAPAEPVAPNPPASDTKEEEEVEEEVDYSTFSKEQLTTALADLSSQDDGYKKGKKISDIKKAYDEIFQAERAEALKKFEADGGSKDDFQYKLDEFSIKFEAYFKILREKKSKNAKEQEKQKERNLELKNALLERLRAFVDDDENTSSINALKKMQEEWKAIGPVHHQHNRTLWANYNALMDRYYDHRSIYFELKELDRKKNLEAKLELCKQAESLDALENLNEAIKRLNELHEEYKHIGPIPKEVQEETWQRFKAASDLVYAKRKDYVSHLKEELGENYEKKVKIAEKIAAYSNFTSDSIGEWNSKTKELLAIQKEWEAVGAMPKDQAKSVNKKFWGDFKSFFHNKSAFFKTLDSQREDNLKKKQELVDKAIELQTSEDWNETANAYKSLQKEWKEIGPVPGKEREKIYKKFKAACDEFFNKKRGHNKEMESSYDDNLKKKEDICASLEALAGAEDLHPEQVYELQDAFNAIGFVPKKTIKAIQNRYQEALNKVIAQAKDFDEEELAELKSLVRINKIKSGPHGDHKLQRKEHSIKRKIQTLEKDVSTWKNNLSFFASSKTANEMLKDFEEKIKKAEAELEELKEELKLITYAEH